MAQRKDARLRFGQTKRLNLDIDQQIEFYLDELKQSWAIDTYSGIVRQSIIDSYLGTRAETVTSVRKKKELAELEKVSNLERVAQLSKILGEKIDLLQEMSGSLKVTRPDLEMPNLAMRISGLVRSNKITGVLLTAFPDRREQIRYMSNSLSKYLESEGMRVIFDGKPKYFPPEDLTNYEAYWDYRLRASSRRKEVSTENSEGDTTQKIKEIFQKVKDGEMASFTIHSDDPLYSNFLDFLSH